MYPLPRGVPPEVMGLVSNGRKPERASNKEKPLGLQAGIARTVQACVSINPFLFQTLMHGWTRIEATKSGKEKMRTGKRNTQARSR
jgi:hypothetical protein